MNRRFTVDGSEILEERLAATCARVADEVRSILPERQLQAIVLGGGYGRGEGGVLKGLAGDQPYNDLEFYVFVRGNRIRQRHRHGCALHALEARLSPWAGLAVEFKLDSLENLRRAPVSMFSYDLVTGHRVVLGEESPFAGCDHHRDARKIPLAEATRLLFNRCSGLLIARELLSRRTLTTEDADFIGRNHAKLKLALGDAVLTAFGLYHWSCCERHRRLAQLRPSTSLPWLGQVQEHHRAAVEFKLHPSRTSPATRGLSADHSALRELALRIWLWLESRRLERPFLSARDYAFDGGEKFPETTRWRNYLLTLRTFGVRAALDSLAWRYPRERLMNALALLLWQPEYLVDPHVIGRVQKQLRTALPDWPGLVGAYERIRPSYG